MKTKTCDLLALNLPRFVPASRYCFEFWLVQSVVFLCRDSPKWLLWFWFYDELKAALIVKLPALETSALLDFFCGGKLILLYLSKVHLKFKLCFVIWQFPALLRFYSLLPLRRKLLCCASDWVSEWVNVTIESEATANSTDFDPIFPRLRDYSRDGVFFRVFYRNVA